MPFLKQSTAIILKMGPFVDETDGVTAETALTIGQVDIQISKAGGALAQTSDGAPTTTHDANGWYPIPLTATDTNTLGKILIQVAMSGALPVWREYTVVPANVYDSLVAGSDDLDVQVAGMDAGVVTAAAVAAGAVDADALATDAVNEIRDAILSDSTAFNGSDIFGLLTNTESILDGARAETAQAGAASTITLDTGASATDDIYKGMIAWLYENTGAGQARIIIAYNGTTKVATVNRAWETNPDATTAFRLIPREMFEIEDDLNSVLTDTAEIGAAGAGLTEAGGDGDHLTEAGGDGDHLVEAGGTGDQLTAVPWNAAWDAEVQSEATDALNAYDPPTKTEMDALIGSPAGADVSTDIAAIKTDTGNLVTRITSTLFSGITSLAEWLGLLGGKQTGDATALAEMKASGAGSGTYDPTTDALEALRDRGDAAWITGGAGSITDILNIHPLIPLEIDLAGTATWRLGLMLMNSLDDLPTTAEITPGTISIDRKAIGGTSWTSVVSDAACSEGNGHIYYDEVFDSGTGYAEGDSIRITFKSQKITVSANDYEISDATGRMFYTSIRQTMRGTDSATYYSWRLAINTVGSTNRLTCLLLQNGQHVTGTNLSITIKKRVDGSTPVDEETITIASPNTDDVFEENLTFSPASGEVYSITGSATINGGTRQLGEVGWQA